MVATLYAVWLLLGEMSPYLLLGFLLAGLMHAFVPAALLRRRLGREGLRSVLLAALVGIPLPLCSCGVIPTAMSLRREGASLGATVSFLIATPQTGVDSIVATYSLMGLPFAIVRPLAALVTALVGGSLTGSAGLIPATASSVRPRAVARIKPALPVRRAVALPVRLVEALRYASFTLMHDIGRWLIGGLVIAGLITALVPTEWFTLFAANPIVEMLVVLLFSIPMYLCATGSIPIAVALMMKGLSPGAALVLLMAGPASNAASVAVVGRVLGRRTLAFYLLSLSLGAMAFGLGINMLPREWFTSALIAQKACCMEPGWFSQVCAVTLCILLINALWPRRTPLEATIYIKGMHCTHCAEAVEKALREVEGVDGVSVSLTDKSACVVGHYRDEDITQAIESIGFKRWNKN